MLRKFRSVFRLLFETLLEQLTLNSSPRLYCLLLNVRGSFVKSNSWFRFDKSEGIFEVSDGSISLTFTEKYANYLSFADGISRRRDYIGNTYLLGNLNFSNGDVVVDCGANIGDLNLWFRFLDLKIDYYGFEPSPREFSHLQANVPMGKNQRIGLWSENSVLEFFISSEKADNSFIRPTTYTEKISVDTFRLDSLLPDKRIKLLKLEAEGAELEVIRGAYSILGNIEYITADLGELSSEVSAVPGVVNYLLENNFELVDFGFHRTVFLFRNKLLI